MLWHQLRRKDLSRHKWHIKRDRVKRTKISQKFKYRPYEEKRRFSKPIVSQRWPFSMTNKSLGKVFHTERSKKKMFFFVLLKAKIIDRSVLLYFALCGFKLWFMFILWMLYLFYTYILGLDYTLYFGNVRYEFETWGCLQSYAACCRQQNPFRKEIYWSKFELMNFGFFNGKFYTI